MGREVALDGGPLILPPGASPLEVTVEGGGEYAGDLLVRTCRTWRLAD